MCLCLGVKVDYYKLWQLLLYVTGNTLTTSSRIPEIGRGMSCAPEAERFDQISWMFGEPDGIRGPYQTKSMGEEVTGQSRLFIKFLIKIRMASKGKCRIKTPCRPMLTYSAELAWCLVSKQSNISWGCVSGFSVFSLIWKAHFHLLLSECKIPNKCQTGYQLVNQVTRVWRWVNLQLVFGFTIAM